jgi:aspartate/methionine/tyrosine aminotransferase
MTDRTRIEAGWVASRARRIGLSAIKEMSIRSARVEGAASLAWGLPSFPTPAPIREAVARALADDPRIGMYALPDGLPELRAAAAADHLARTGRAVDPDREVTVTAGNMEGLATLLGTVCAPGDEVVVTDPGFASHIQQIQYNGARPVFWEMDGSRGWALDLDALDRIVGPRTKAILLVTPSNPTGRVLAAGTLRAVGRIARERGCLVILDDPYSHFLYESRARYWSLASDPASAGHVAYLFTFSKAYAMSGWRCGYMVLPESLREQVVKIHDLTMICAPRIAQVAALAALTGPGEHLAAFEAVLARRRGLICERLDRMPHVFDYVRPEGAYYVFPRYIRGLGDSVSFAHALLETARVAVTPGSAFGPSGEGHVRMAFCVEDDVIDLAFDRMEARFGVEP